MVLIYFESFKNLISLRIRVLKFMTIYIPVGFLLNLIRKSRLRKPVLLVKLLIFTKNVGFTRAGNYVRYTGAYYC